MREIRISDIDLDKTLIKAQKIAKRSQVKGLEGGYKVSIGQLRSTPHSDKEIITTVSKQFSTSSKEFLFYC